MQKTPAVICSILSLFIMASCSLNQSTQDTTTTDSATSVTTDNSSTMEVSTNIATETNTIGDIWDLNIGFEFPYPVMKEANGNDENSFIFYNDITYLTDKSADKVLFATNRSTDFDVIVEGLGQMTMPTYLKNELLTDADACFNVQNTEKMEEMTKEGILHLPINLSKPFVCKSQKSDGMVTIALIGNGDIYEALPYLNTVLLVIKENEIISFNGILLKDLLKNFTLEYKTLVNDFVAKNPDTNFGTKSFETLTGLVNEKISSTIQTPTAELTAALEQINNIAATITLK